MEEQKKDEHKKTNNVVIPKKAVASKKPLKPMKPIVREVIEKITMPRPPTKAEIQKWANKDVRMSFKMKELALIYDAMYLTPYGDLRNNVMLSEFGKVFEKIERLVVPELYSNKAKGAKK